MSAVLQQPMEWFLVKPDQIEDVWGDIVEGVKRAIDVSHGESSIDDIKKFLVDGEMMLLLMRQNTGAFGVIWSLQTFPQYKVGRIFLAFGKDLWQMKDAIEAAAQWGKRLGCAYIEAWCPTESRARLFSLFGYKPVYTVIRKKL